MEEELLSGDMSERKNLLVQGMCREYEYSQDMLKESQLVITSLFDRVAYLERRLSEQDVEMKVLRAGLKRRHDELLEKDLDNVELRREVKVFVEEVIPHICETLAAGPEAVALVDAVVSASKKKGMMLAQHSDQSSEYLQAKEAFDQAISKLANYQSNYVYDLTHLHNTGAHSFLVVKPRFG